MRVLHVIPNDGLGGVEVAAKSAVVSQPELDVIFVSSSISNSGYFKKIWLSINAIFKFSVFSDARLTQSRTAVFSLWKTTILLIYWKIRFRQKALLFLHSSKDKHFLDFMLTRLALLCCDGILADSRRTLQQRVPSSIRVRKWTRVVSMLVDIPRCSSSYRITRKAERFIYWGRFNSNKNIELALKLFSIVKKQLPQASFLLIGPNDGTLLQCKELAQTLELGDAVEFLPPLSLEAIASYAAEATFFIQLSHYEGFGMSVAEAMRFGLIPVVTAVGEIAEYCVHGKNAIIYQDLRATSAAILEIASSSIERERLSSNAAGTWEGDRCYAMDFMQAIAEFQEKNEQAA